MKFSRYILYLEYAIEDLCGILNKFWNDDLRACNYIGVFSEIRETGRDAE
jgi:hypothetical protein